MEIERYGLLLMRFDFKDRTHTMCSILYIGRMFSLLATQLFVTSIMEPALGLLLTPFDFQGQN